MIIFYFALLITIFFYWTSSLGKVNKNINIYMVLMFITLTLFGVFRYNVGSDFLNYYFFFKGEVYFEGRYEPGYSLLNYLVNTVWNNPQAIIMITHLIIMGLAFIVINKYSIDKSLSTFLFVFGFFYFDSLNIIRQSIALVICLYGIHKFLLKNNIIKFIICVIIASMFHYSALINLIMILIKNLKVRKKYIVILFSLVLVFNIFYEKIMPIFFTLISKLPYTSEYSVYENLSNNINSKPYDLIVYVLILILSTFVFKKIDLKYVQYNIYKNLLLITILLKGFALNFKYLDRVASYFGIYIIFLIPIIFKESNIKEKGLVKLTLMALFILYCWVRIKSGQAGVNDYNFNF